MILVVGRNGNLSLALQRIFQDKDIRVVGSDIAHNWSTDEGVKKIEKDLDKLGIEPNLILNAAGEVDPKANSSKLSNLNFNLPKNLEVYARSCGIKLVTFGTILENLENLAVSNPYLASKRQYLEHFQKVVPGKSHSLHVQIHTWYGLNKPHMHMFLGQIFQSLKTNEPFKMSAGNQLREYHYVYDDLKALQFLMDQEFSGIIQINHGEILSLKEIAFTLFKSFDALHLLKIGSLKTPAHEVIVKKFNPIGILESVEFKPTLPGLIDDFVRLLKESR